MKKNGRLLTITITIRFLVSTNRNLVPRLIFQLVLSVVLRVILLITTDRSQARFTLLNLCSLTPPFFSTLFCSRNTLLNVYKLLIWHGYSSVTAFH